MVLLESNTSRHFINLEIELPAISAKYLSANGISEVYTSRNCIFRKTELSYIRLRFEAFHSCKLFLAFTSISIAE